MTAPIDKAKVREALVSLVISPCLDNRDALALALGLHWNDGIGAIEVADALLASPAGVSEALRTLADRFDACEKEARAEASHAAADAFLVARNLTLIDLRVSLAALAVLDAALSAQSGDK